MTTSSDGILTATTDPATASIKLTADFTGYTGGVPAATVNLMSNPGNDDTVGWLAGANCVAVPRSNTQAHAGGWSARLTAVAAGNIIASTLNGFFAYISPSTPYVASAYMRAGSAGRTCTLTITWFSAGFSVLSSVNGTPVADGSGGWTRISAAATAPATAFYVSITVTVTGAAAAEIHYVDSVQLEQGSVPTAYCGPTELGVLQVAQGGGALSVRPAYTQLTIRRADGTIVRGADNAVAPGGIGKGYDHEAPPGTAIVYTAYLSNGVVTVASTTATATITGQATVTWLKSLRTPGLSVMLDIASPPDWSSAVPAAALYPLAGKYPLVQGVQRRAKTGAMAVNTTDRAGLNALELLLETDGVGPFLLQFASNSGEPDRYVSVLDVLVAWDVPLATTQDRTVSFPLIEVARPPTIGSTVTIPGKSYADSGAVLPLYSNRTGSYGSRS